MGVCKGKNGNQRIWMKKPLVRWNCAVGAESFLLKTVEEGEIE